MKSFHEAQPVCHLVLIKANEIWFVEPSWLVFVLNATDSTINRTKKRTHILKLAHKMPIGY